MRMPQNTASGPVQRRKAADCLAAALLATSLRAATRETRATRSSETKADKVSDRRAHTPAKTATTEVVNQTSPAVNAYAGPHRRAASQQSPSSASSSSQAFAGNIACAPNQTPASKASAPLMSRSIVAFRRRRSPQAFRRLLA